MKHKQQQHHGSGDAAGWVEGLSALSEASPATALVVGSSHGDPAASPPSPGIKGGAAGVSAPAPAGDGSHAGGTAAGSAAAGAAAAAQSFEDACEHAAGLVAAELEAMGEVLVQLGVPGGGWGPAPLTNAQADALVARLRATADAAGAELTVLQRGPVGAATAAAASRGSGSNASGGGAGGRRAASSAAAGSGGEAASTGDEGGSGPASPDVNSKRGDDQGGTKAAAAGGKGDAGSSNGDSSSSASSHIAVDLLLRQRPGTRPPLEVRVAVVGNVDSGKSTLVGVLTRGALDDGRGLARSKVFKHSHEAQTGRTSSIGQHNLCLDAGGRILNDPSFRAATCADFIARSAKVVTLVDLAGHEKYFRTTAFGLTGHLPDYCCHVVGANMGVVGMAREHLGIALALRVPVFFVVTKTDLAPAHVLRSTLTALADILRRPGVRRRPFLVRGLDDALAAARLAGGDAIAPIFLTSSVTGAGLDLVRAFFGLAPQRVRWAQRRAEPAELLIDEVFGVPGVGTVVAGTVKRGVLTPASTLVLGPDPADGSFRAAQVRSIHYKRLPVGAVVAGQTAAVALKKLKRSQVRKGQVLLDARTGGAGGPRASFEFESEIAVLSHATTIAPRYQAVIHAETVRQAARVVALDREVLRSGDRARIRWRFIQRPEWLVPGTRFVFREGRTKGIGVVTATQGSDPEAWDAPLAPAAAAAATTAAAAAGGSSRRDQGGGGGGAQSAAPAGCGAEAAAAAAAGSSRAAAAGGSAAAAARVRAP